MFFFESDRKLSVILLSGGRSVQFCDPGIDVRLRFIGEILAAFCGDSRLSRFQEYITADVFLPFREEGRKRPELTPASCSSNNHCTDSASDSLIIQNISSGGLQMPVRVLPRLLPSRERCHE